MSKMFKCEQDFEVPYADANVKEGPLSHRLFVEAAGPDDAGNTHWRFLTTEEEATYHAAHDHARADDDGMGAAVGATPASLAVEGNTSDYNEDDLGAKWGSVTEDSAEVADLKATMASEGHAVWDLGIGVNPAAATERALADQAIAFINSTVGNLDKTRYTLVVFHMDSVNPETTGGKLESYSLVSTIDRRALTEVAYNEAVKGAEARVAGDNTSLEI